MQARTDHTAMKATEDQTAKVRHIINNALGPCLLSSQLFGLCIFVPGTPRLPGARLPAYPGVGGGGSGLLPTALSPIVPVLDLSSVWVTDDPPTEFSW